MNTRARSCKAAAPLVLVVDDDLLVGEVLGEILVTLGCTVVRADNGVDALQQVTRHADALALVLVDLNMPDIQGDEVARRIRLACPHLPIVLMSGSRIQIDRTVANITLLKPFGLAEMRILLSTFGLIRTPALERLERVRVGLEPQILDEIEAEAERLGRGVSDLIQDAWRIARHAV